MKKKIIALSVFAASTLAVLAGLPSTTSNESTRDPFGVNELTIKNLQVGEEAEVKHSETMVQIGVKGDKSYLRFATAISGPIKSATYTRTRSDQEGSITKNVQYVYAGIKAEDDIYYYTAEGKTTEKPETISYYWACYTLSFSSSELKDVDFGLTLTLVGEDDQLIEVPTRTSSFNDLVTKYTATLSNATFNEESSVQLKPGDKLPAVTFDGELEEAYVVDSDGNAALIDQYVMPEHDVTLTVHEREPYVTSGYGKLNVGYANNGSNGFTRKNAYSAWSTSISWGSSRTLIGNSTDGYDVAEVLNLNDVKVLQTSEDKTGNNANFRLMTAYQRKTNTKYHYIFTFKNLGNTDLDFDIFKRNSGSDKSTPVEKYNVKVAAGATTKVEFDWLNSTPDNNDLTYFKFNSAVSNGAMAITYYIDNPLKHMTFTATLNDATFADGSAVATLKYTDTLPEVIYNEPTTNKTLGWLVEDPNGNKTYELASKFVMPGYNVKLTPYNTVEYVAYKDTGDGHLNTWSSAAPHENQIDPNNSSAGITASLSRTPVIEGDKIGTNMTIEAEADEFFRFRHGFHVSSTDTNTIYYTLKNKGEATAKFTLYQVNSGTNITGVPSANVELAPGETKIVPIAFKFPNENIMAIFKFAEAYTGTIWMAQDFNVDFDKKYTATLANGATFANGTSSYLLRAGSLLPSIVYDDSTITSEAYNLGFIVKDEQGNKSYVLKDDFVMPDHNVTLTPYNTVKFMFKTENKAAGELDTWTTGLIYDGEGNNDYNANTIYTNGASASFKGLKFEGDRPGSLLSVNAQEGKSFRAFHAYFTEKTEPVNKYITYTFKNYSETETAKFTFVQKYKSGFDLNVAGEPNVNVEIAPGETYTFTVENPMRSNGNIIWVMHYTSAFNGNLFYAARVDATNPSL